MLHVQDTYMYKTAANLILGQFSEHLPFLRHSEEHFNLKGYDELYGG